MWIINMCHKIRKSLWMIKRINSFYIFDSWFNECPFLIIDLPMKVDHCFISTCFILETEWERLHFSFWVLFVLDIFFNNAVFPGMFMTRSLHHLLKEKLPDDVLSFLSSVFPLGAVSPKQKSLIINWQADTLFTVMNTEAFVLFRFDVNSFSFIINNSFRVNVFILIIMII